jgi:hypothetical protein
MWLSNYLGIYEVRSQDFELARGGWARPEDESIPDEEVDDHYDDDAEAIGNQVVYTDIDECPKEHLIERHRYDTGKVETRPHA